MSNSTSMHMHGGQKCLVKFLPISLGGTLPPEWTLPGLLQFCDVASHNDIPSETDHPELRCVEHIADLPNGAAVQSLVECLAMRRWYCDNKAASGLGVQQRIVACDVGLMR